VSSDYGAGGNKAHVILISRQKKGLVIAESSPGLLFRVPDATPVLDFSLFNVHIMNMKLRRTYRQTLRAQMAADTEKHILEEAQRLFSTNLFDRVSLAAVARAAEVTIPTIQRRYGSKDGLFAAAAARVRTRIHHQRGTPPLGDVRACIVELVAHYELEGRMVWHLLRQEADVPLLRPAMEEGRKTHRAWVEEVFAPYLDRTEGKRRRASVDALVAVTDVFTWKLLRLDLGRSRGEVETLMNATAAAVAGGL
jgi:AcrR family transcriptional regulator